MATAPTDVITSTATLTATLTTIPTAAVTLTPTSIVSTESSRQQSSGDLVRFWIGEYYSNPLFSGQPQVVRGDPQINFDWGEGSPDEAIASDRFTVRWRYYRYFEEGEYRFFTLVDDGMRLYVDERLLIDSWQIQEATEYSDDISLSEGYHAIRVEYFEHEGPARILVDWRILTEDD